MSHWLNNIDLALANALGANEDDNTTDSSHSSSLTEDALQKTNVSASAVDSASTNEHIVVSTAENSTVSNESCDVDEDSIHDVLSGDNGGRELVSAAILSQTSIDPTDPRRHRWAAATDAASEISIVSGMCAVCYGSWGNIGVLDVAKEEGSCFAATSSFSSFYLSCSRCQRRCHKGCVGLGEMVLPCDKHCGGIPPTPLEDVSANGTVRVSVVEARHRRRKNSGNGTMPVSVPAMRVRLWLDPGANDNDMNSIDLVDSKIYRSSCLLACESPWAEVASSAMKEASKNAEEREEEESVMWEGAAAVYGFRLTPKSEDSFQREPSPEATMQVQLQLRTSPPLPPSPLPQQAVGDSAAPVAPPEAIPEEQPVEWSLKLPLMPLFLYPNVAVERWFALGGCSEGDDDDGGEGDGANDPDFASVRLRLTFEPDAVAPQSPVAESSGEAGNEPGTTSTGEGGVAIVVERSYRGAAAEVPLNSLDSSHLPSSLTPTDSASQSHDRRHVDGRSQTEQRDVEFSPESNGHDDADEDGGTSGVLKVPQVEAPSSVELVPRTFSQTPLNSDKAPKAPLLPEQPLTHSPLATTATREAVAQPTPRPVGGLLVTASFSAATATATAAASTSGGGYSAPIFPHAASTLPSPSSLLPPMLPDQNSPETYSLTTTTTMAAAAEVAAAARKTKRSSGRVHLFRVATLRRPGWCAACGKMLVGLYHQGHACEECGLLVHSECQQSALRADSHLGHLHCPPSCPPQRAPVPPATNTKQPSSASATVLSESTRVPSARAGDASCQDERAQGRGNDLPALSQETASLSVGGADPSSPSMGADAVCGGAAADVLSSPPSLPPPAPPLAVGVGTSVVEVMLAHRCSPSCCDAPLSWLGAARHPHTLGHCSAFLGPRRRKEAVRAVADMGRAHRRSDGSQPFSVASASAPASAWSAAGEERAEVARAHAEMEQAHGIVSWGRGLRRGERPCGEAKGSDGDSALKGSDLFVRLYMGGQAVGRTPTCFATRTAAFSASCQANDDAQYAAAAAAAAAGGAGVGAASLHTSAAAAEVLVEEGARFKVTAPHHRASLSLHLVDANTDRVVGALEVPVAKLLQREVDSKVEGWEAQLDLFVDLPLLAPPTAAAGRGGGTSGVPASSLSSSPISPSPSSSATPSHASSLLAAWSVADPTPWPAQTAASSSSSSSDEKENKKSSSSSSSSSNSSSSNRHSADSNSSSSGDAEGVKSDSSSSSSSLSSSGGATAVKGWGAGPGPSALLCEEVVGFVRVRLRYSEAADLCRIWPALPPRPVPPPPKEEFSIAKFQSHIARAGAIIAWVSSWLRAYHRLVSWEQPLHSAAALAFFVWACMFADAEYAPCVPALLAVLFLANGYARRAGGGFVDYWLRECPSTAGVFGFTDSFPSIEKQAVSSLTASSRSRSRSSGARRPAVAEGGQGEAASESTVEDGGAVNSDDADIADSRHDGFTPLALLRVAVVRGRGLGLRRRALKPSKRHRHKQGRHHDRHGQTTSANSSLRLLGDDSDGSQAESTPSARRGWLRNMGTQVVQAMGDIAAADDDDHDNYGNEKSQNKGSKAVWDQNELVEASSSDRDSRKSDGGNDNNNDGNGSNDCDDDDDDDCTSLGSDSLSSGVSRSRHGSGTFDSVDDFDDDDFDDGGDLSERQTTAQALSTSHSSPSTPSSVPPSSTPVAPVVETFQARPSRYSVKVTFVPSFKEAAAAAAGESGDEDEEDELFIGHTRYSDSRTHDPVWGLRTSYSDYDDSDVDYDNASSRQGSQHRGGGGGGGVGRASGLFRPLLEAFLPGEDGEGAGGHRRGGGNGGCGGSGACGGGGARGRGPRSDGSMLTVHSVKKGWRRRDNPASQLLDEEEDLAFFYHVLQPRRRRTDASSSVGGSGDDTGSSGDSGGELIPWSRNTPGCLRFRVLAEAHDSVGFGEDAMQGGGAVADRCVAQLDLPLSQLLNASRDTSSGANSGDAPAVSSSTFSSTRALPPSGAQNEVECWFALNEPGGKPPQHPLPAVQTGATRTTNVEQAAAKASPSLHVRAQLILRDAEKEVSREERGVSAAVEAAHRRARERWASASRNCQRRHRQTHSHRKAQKDKSGSGRTDGNATPVASAAAVSTSVSTILGSEARQTLSHNLGAGHDNDSANDFAGGGEFTGELSLLAKGGKEEDDDEGDEVAFLGNSLGFLSTAIGELGSSVGPPHALARQGDGGGLNGGALTSTYQGPHYSGLSLDRDNGGCSGGACRGGGGGGGDGGGGVVSSGRKFGGGRSSRAAAVVHHPVSLLPTGRAGADAWFEGHVGLRSVSDSVENGSSGGALSTLLGLRETAAWVQNGLGDTLDLLERGKNLLNWSHPERTAIVFAVSVALWLLLALIPFRFLLLAVGLFEFFKKFLPAPSQDAPPSPPFHLANNLLACAPTDEALRLCYAHEAKFLAAVGEDAQRGRTRRARLRLLHGCQWDAPLARLCMGGGGFGGGCGGGSGAVGIVDDLFTASSSIMRGGGAGGCSGGGGAGGGAGGWGVESPPLVVGAGGWVRGGFAVLQGRRLLWWRAEVLLEGGAGADACLALRGHAGVTAPSPSDLRIAPASRLCVVFCVEPPSRNDPAGSRQRWTLVFASEAERDGFVSAVERAIEKDA